MEDIQFGVYRITYAGLEGDTESSAVLSNGNCTAASEIEEICSGLDRK